MRKLIVLLCILCPYLKSQTVDTATWQLIPDNLTGKYSYLTNRATYYGLSAGSVKILLVYTGIVDTSIWSFLPNTLTGKVDKFTNRASKYGISAGGIVIKYVYSATGSVDVFNWTFMQNQFGFYTLLFNSSTYLGQSSGVLQLPFWYDATLDTLGANVSAGSIWIGQYLATFNAADTSNRGTDTLELFMNHSWHRFRQDGTTAKCSLYVYDITKITFFQFKIWRPLSTTSNNGHYLLIGSSGNMTSLLANGNNSITPPRILNVQDGDYYSISIIGTGNAIACPMTTQTSFNRFFTRLQTDSLDMNWSSGTVIERYYPIRFYSDTAPIAVLMGNSIIDGTINYTYSTRYNSGVSHLNYSSYDRNFTLGYKLYRLLGWTFQNVGVAGQGTAGMASRNKTDATDQLPRVEIIEGGINDATLYAQVIHNNRRKMIDSAIVHSIIPIVEGLMPTVQRTNAFMQTVDSVNVLDSAYCRSIGVKWLNLMTPLGRARDTGTPTPTAGNRWDLRPEYTIDDIHPTNNGNGVITRNFWLSLKGTYVSYGDTVRSYINTTDLVDTVEEDLPLTIKVNAYSFFGIDSVIRTWYKNFNGTATRIKMRGDSVETSSTMEFTCQFGWDTSTVGTTDTIYYADTAYGYTNAFTSLKHVRFTHRVPDYRTNLYAYWRADSNVTLQADSVVSWKSIMDTLTARNSTTGTRPELTTINGYSVLYFTSGTQVLDFTVKQITLGGWTIIAVYKSTAETAASINVILSGTATDLRTCTRLATDGFGVLAGADYRAEDCPSQCFDTIWASRVYQSAKLYRNLTEPTYATSGTGLPLTLNVSRFGGRSPIQFPYFGYLVELRVYSEVVSLANLTTVYTWQKHTYPNILP